MQCAAWGEGERGLWEDDPVLEVQGVACVSGSTMQCRLQAAFWSVAATTATMSEILTSKNGSLYILVLCRGLVTWRSMFPIVVHSPVLTTIASTSSSELASFHTWDMNFIEELSTLYGIGECD